MKGIKIYFGDEKIGGYLKVRFTVKKTGLKI
jgi:hypothetical protein